MALPDRLSARLAAYGFRRIRSSLKGLKAVSVKFVSKAESAIYRKSRKS